MTGETWAAFLIEGYAERAWERGETRYRAPGEKAWAVKPNGARVAGDLLASAGGLTYRYEWSWQTLGDDETERTPGALLPHRLSISHAIALS